MFEQTLIVEKGNARKRFTVLLSLSLQIGMLAVMIIAPLIFTHVLPSAQLRSVLAYPGPPPALPKVPPSLRTKTTATILRTSTFVFQPKSVTPRPTNPTPEIVAPIGTISTDELVPVGQMAMTSLPATPPPQPPPTAKPAAKTVRVHTQLSPADLIRRVQPIYPPQARSIHLQGSVEFSAVISKTGDIENLQLLHGHPLLVNAAREAILQWKYRPTILNGEPVEVVTNIVVNFTLAQ